MNNKGKILMNIRRSITNGAVGSDRASRISTRAQRLCVCICYTLSLEIAGLRPQRALRVLKGSVNCECICYIFSLKTAGIKHQGALRELKGYVDVFVVDFH